MRQGQHPNSNAEQWVVALLASALGFNLVRVGQVRPRVAILALLLFLLCLYFASRRSPFSNGQKIALSLGPLVGLPTLAWRFVPWRLRAGSMREILEACAFWLVLAVAEIAWTVAFLRRLRQTRTPDGPATTPSS